MDSTPGAEPSCTTCDVDKKPDGSPLARCAGCKTAAYCSKECQTQDWKRGHKKTCAGIKPKKTETYGPRGETRKQWDALLMAQGPSYSSEAAYTRAAKARKGKPIEYEHPVYESAQILRFAANDSDAEREKLMEAKSILQVVISPDIQALDAVSAAVRVIAKAPAEFRNRLRSFQAGDPTRTKACDITNTSVEALVKACPKLEHITLHGTRYLTEAAFPMIFLNCQGITALTVTIAKQFSGETTKLEPGEENSWQADEENSWLDWLMDKTWLPKLRYLEFYGIKLPRDRRNWLDTVTRFRPKLEIIWGDWEHESVLIRDMYSTRLDRVPSRSDPTKPVAGKKLAKPKTHFSDPRISNDPKENARTLAKLGQQSAHRMMLGRDDFEMDSDDFDEPDSDEEIEPEDMERLLKVMDQMDAMGSDDDYEDDYDYY